MYKHDPEIIHRFLECDLNYDVVGSSCVGTTYKMLRLEKYREEYNGLYYKEIFEKCTTMCVNLNVHGISEVAILIPNSAV